MTTPTPTTTTTTTTTTTIRPRTEANLPGCCCAALAAVQRVPGTGDLGRRGEGGSSRSLSLPAARGVGSQPCGPPPPETVVGHARSERGGRRVHHPGGRGRLFVHPGARRGGGGAGWSRRRRGCRVVRFALPNCGEAVRLYGRLGWELASGPRCIAGARAWRRERSAS
ncbi:hypothetical protein F4780DRAFT_717726 [Xylariomycetidae sp. FL0641]|nr:hypothetical protein F4780DRAFT_717726 [Xylariomycetidae sp. FL0641]